MQKKARFLVRHGGSALVPRVMSAGGGHLKALKNRVVHLEAMLESRLPDQQLQRDLQGSQHSSDPIIPASPGVLADSGLHAAGEWPQEPTNLSQSGRAALFDGHTSDLVSSSLEWSFPPALTVSNTQFPPTDFLHDELDQLYLDRVHQSIPIINQRRYLSWSKSSSKAPSQKCLQNAMWALASLLSAQFREMIEPLYQKTKQTLESISIEGNDYNVNTELAQAWVLVVIFESMRTHHRQAWMSAGRAFRLVQAMRYHEIDRPTDKGGPSSPRNGDFIQVEERRRVFWMAYFLDHVISMRDDWPITLNEHVICTRLPALDSDFQSGNHELGLFLSEAMTQPTLKLGSSFNECLILATICGRTLLQIQQYQISKAYGDTLLDSTEQRRWLDSLLTTRLQALSQYYPSPIKAYDPLLLFANILGQVTVIYFCKAMMESMPASANPLQGDAEFSDYQNRALEASTTIIHLATTLCELPIAKIHPLMPIPLFSCAEFLYANMHTSESFQLRIQELFYIFRRLKNVNNHEKSYLDLLPKSCISKTTEMLNNSVQGSTPDQFIGS
ncbi:hypothetical protein PENARI_c003G05074 [Penicillium arizonense]|uniref:Xylanolytic transcriptional activator regulatory domain-containing protein n=1 Tax=Penicillium arizonense TaxID=1835702 RepID=A0A1F5LTT1_PENAI|nr:hypothetical protein PENARI_c003G05074 [Penicillium arizonense]OGE56339.1 hypothetical protein PENARI_c003G05074 [Penicillium arizonense]